MEFTDDLGNTLIFDNAPKRIVSLVPSVTELLFDLGLGKQVIGVTRYCIHPKEECILKENIGGTKDFNINKIISLEPDLIIAVKEENDKDLVLNLSNTHQVVVFDVTSYKSAVNMIDSIATITEKEVEAKQLVNSIEMKKNELSLKRKSLKNACYLIWNKPLMTINNENFISEMMAFAGYSNVFAQKTKTYPEITNLEIKSMNPEFILLSSEPFPFKEKHQENFKKEFPNAQIILVDGEMFSWYGSRMLKAFQYFIKCP